MNKLIDNCHVKINHPMADTISISIGDRAYCGEDSSEIAFFQNNEWVVTAIPEFCTYQVGHVPNNDDDHADTSVYGWVPNDLLLSFLEKFGVKK